MSSFNIDIQVNGQSLHLGDKFDVEFKIVNNLAQLNLQGLDYSLPANLPSTDHNDAILGNVNRIDVGQKKYSLPCKVYVNYNLYYSGKLVYKEGSRNTYKYVILVDGATVDFLNESLRKANWGEISDEEISLSNFDFAQAHVPGRLFVFPPTATKELFHSLEFFNTHELINAFDFDNQQYYADAVPSPWINLAEMVKRYFTLKNYRVTGSFFSHEAGKRLCFPTNILADSKAEYNPQIYQRTVLGALSSTTGSGILYFDNPNYTDDLDLFDMVGSTLKCKYPGVYNITIDGPGGGIYTYLKHIAVDLGKKEFRIKYTLVVGGQEVAVDEQIGTVNGTNDTDDHYYANLSHQLIITEDTVDTEVQVLWEFTSEDGGVEAQFVGAYFIVDTELVLDRNAANQLSNYIPDQSVKEFLDSTTKVFPLGMYFNPLRNELKINLELPQAINSGSNDWSAKASRDYINRPNEQKGYRLNYNYPSPSEDSELPEDLDVVATVNQYSELLNPTCYEKQSIKVLSHNAYYKKTAKPNAFESFTLVAYEEGDIVVGDGETEFKSKFYPVRMINKYYDMPHPLPDMEFISLIAKDKDPTGKYAVQLAFYHGAQIGFRNNDLDQVNYPMASPYCRSVTGLLIMPFALWYHDSEGLYQKLYKFFLAIFFGEELEQYFRLSEDEVQGLDGSEIIIVNNIAFIIKELYIGYTIHKMKSVKAIMYRLTSMAYE